MATRVTVRFEFLRFYWLVWMVQAVTSEPCEVSVSASPGNIVRIGDSVVLNCIAGPGLSGIVSWTKGQFQAITVGGTNPCHCKGVYDDRSGFAFVNVTDASDLGLYTCTLQLSFTTTCTATVDLIKAEQPHISSASNTSSVTANQGSPVAFTITILNPGTPVASVVWTKDGARLSNSSNVFVNDTMLQLSATQPGDRGQYVATATNREGSSSVSFSLYESFYPVVNMSVTTMGSMAVLQCDAYGYPALTDLAILDTHSISHITASQDGYTWWGSATATQLLTGCPTTFLCSASNSFGKTTVSTVACAVGIDLFSVKPVGTDGAYLQWVSALKTISNFTVMYLLDIAPGSSAYTLGPTVTCQTCNFTIYGLIPGGTYKFAIGYSAAAGGIQISQSMAAPIGTGLGAVTMVTATPVNMLSNVIAVTWGRTPYAFGYLVYVNYGLRDAFIVNVTLDTSVRVAVKCMALNTIQIQAYNSSGFSSLSPAVQTYTYCSPNPAIKSVTTDNSVLKITFSNIPFGAIKVTAIQDDGSGYSWNVTLDANGMACLAGIPQGAGYSVCASFVQGSSDCYSEKVSIGKGDPLQPCGSAIFGSPATTSPIASVTGSGLNPLVIGIIIVSVFGGLATLVCIVGLFLACRKGKTSDYDFSSSTGVSIKESPTPEVPSYNQINASQEMNRRSPLNPYDRSGRGSDGLYNQTFDRSWSNSFVKNHQPSGTCSTAV